MERDRLCPGLEHPVLGDADGRPAVAAGPGDVLLSALAVRLIGVAGSSSGQSRPAENMRRRRPPRTS
jgi:hypothetical protein